MVSYSQEVKITVLGITLAFFKLYCFTILRYFWKIKLSQEYLNKTTKSRKQGTLTKMYYDHEMQSVFALKLLVFLSGQFCCIAFQYKFHKVYNVI